MVEVRGGVTTTRAAGDFVFAERNKTARLNACLRSGVSRVKMFFRK